MPKIETYQSRVQTPGPIDVPRANAETMGAGLGRGLAQLGEGITSFADRVHKVKEDQEISDTSAKMAKAQADLTAHWNETLRTADPSDKTIVEKFQEKVKERFDSIREGISTRGAVQHFDVSSSRLGAHFQEMAFGGQAHLAGLKAKEDYESSISNRSSALMQNPNSFKITLEEHRDDLERRVSSGNLSRADAIKLDNHAKLSFAMSAVRGWTKTNPEYAQEQLDSGKWDEFITGEAKHRMDGEIKTAIRAKEHDERQREAELKRIRAEKIDKLKGNFFDKIVETNGAGVTWKQIYESDMDFSDKLQMFNLKEHAATQKIKTDPSVMINMVSRIYADDNDPHKIKNEQELLAPYFAKQISLEDVNKLRAEFQGKKTVSGKIEHELKSQVLKVAEQTLVKTNPMMGIKDASGEEQYLKFLNYFHSEFDKQREAGKTAKELLDPDSPDYLGKGINKFRKTPKQIMQDNMKYMRASPQVTPTPAPTPPPKKDKESPAEYLKRIGQ